MRRLTEYATWRAIFWTSAGLAALIAIGAWIFVPDDRDIPIENRDVDWLGAGLITVGLALVTFALADGSGAPDGVRLRFPFFFLYFEDGTDFGKEIVENSLYTNFIRHWYHINYYFLVL